uniref:Uncharacterized protein n=1 Tax=Physcomitrium patens TaxID=3218 RepID=A0A2K1IED9_PHYPA|nr:hypothetical protein PHYPA_029792 [Physcomitrium patens]
MVGDIFTKDLICEKKLAGIKVKMGTGRGTKSVVDLVPAEWERTWEPRAGQGPGHELSASQGGNEGGSQPTRQTDSPPPSQPSKPASSYSARPGWMQINEVASTPSTLHSGGAGFDLLPWPILFPSVKRLRARIHYCRFYLLTPLNSTICINKQHYLFASAFDAVTTSNRALP